MTLSLFPPTLVYYPFCDLKQVTKLFFPILTIGLCKPLLSAEYKPCRTEGAAPIPQATFHYSAAWGPRCQHTHPSFQLTAGLLVCITDSNSTQPHRRLLTLYGWALQSSQCYNKQGWQQAGGDLETYSKHVLFTEPCRWLRTALLTLSNNSCSSPPIPVPAVPAPQKQQRASNLPEQRIAKDVQNSVTVAISASSQGKKKKRQLICSFLSCFRTCRLCLRAQLCRAHSQSQLWGTQREPTGASEEKPVAGVQPEITLADSVPGHPGYGVPYSLAFAHTVLSPTWDLHMLKGSERDHFPQLPGAQIAQTVKHPEKLRGSWKCSFHKTCRKSAAQDSDKNRNSISKLTALKGNQILSN